MSFTTSLRPLYRHSIGFDRFNDLFDLAFKAAESSAGNSYPPYNVEKTGENTYRITMAVAGFSDKDIEIMAQENTLNVNGKVEEEINESEYLYKGIATRSFQRKFSLADHVEVTDAILEDGLLKIDLVREIPEEKKPRMINLRKNDKKLDVKKTASAARKDS